MIILTKNLWLISIRQSFLNLLPYFIMIGLSILFHQLLEIYSLKENIFYSILSKTINLFSFSTPLIISTSISYFLAKNFDLNRPTIPVVNFLLFIFFYWEYKDIDEININIKLNFLMIIIPLLTVYIYMKIFNFINTYYKLDDINEELRDVLKSIIPFLFTFLFCVILIKILIQIALSIANVIDFSYYASLPIELSTFLNLIFAGIIWWTTGIHGTNLVISFFGEEYLNQTIVGNIDANILINNFIIYGGDGSTLALILAIIFFIKDSFVRKIAFISLPFAIFNINEIVLFALPIILNPRLFIPFILVPLSNFLIAYIFFYLYPINNPDFNISWITPIFISGYYIDHSFTYVYLQIIQLIIAMAIYLPFIKKYADNLKENENFKNFKNSLGIDDYVEKTSHLNFIKSQQDIINDEKEISKLIKELNAGEFLLYYQPKINFKSSKIKGYEALLRFKKKDTKIMSAYFIDKLEQIGYEQVIDFWVINQLKKDLLIWSKDNFYPTISINISPESISNKLVIDKIIKDFKGFKVDIEILERTFAKDMNTFLTNINKLRANGFTISVDDFGSGFSSLQYLNILPADSIKLDRSLILNTKTSSGEKLYKSIASMCQNQGFEIVAEGIETDEEMRIVEESNIEVIQGFYFSKALPFDELQDYEKELEKTL